MNNKHKKIILIASAIIAVAIIAIFSWRKTEVSLKGISVIDRVIFGQDARPVDGQGIVIKENDVKNDEESLDKAVLMAKEIEIFSRNQDQEAEAVFENPYSLSKGFELRKNMKETDTIRIDFNAESKKMYFVLPSIKAMMDGTEIITKEVVLKEFSDVQPGSIVKIGELTLNLGSYGNDRYISLGELKDKEIKIYKPSGANLIDGNSFSFESSLWSQAVGDCSKGLAGDAKISMNLASDGSHGFRSLRLASGNHNACTNKTFPVAFNANSFYKFSFDYRSLKGNKVKFYYKLIGAGNAEKAGDIVAPNRDWNHYENLITSGLAGKKGIQVYFYAPSDGKSETENLYDKVWLEEYAFDRSEKVAEFEKTAVLADNLKLKNGESRFGFAFDEKNLLAQNNASFEDGTWAKQVGDCSNKMAGKAQMSMDISGDASEGGKALRIYSANHHACTNKIFPIEISAEKTYKLSFDYKSLKGESVKYFYRLSNDNDNTDFTENIKPLDNEWNHVEKVIKSEIKATNKFQIYFYASSDGKQEVENLYDNVKLEEYIPDDASEFYFSANQEVPTDAKFKSVEYKSAGMFKTGIILHGVKDSFLLSNSESYSSLWNLYVWKNDKKLEKPIFPEKYWAPDDKINEQAIRPEVKSFIENGLISYAGLDFISKQVDGAIRNENMPNPPYWETLFGHKISERNHFKINDYGNAWFVNVDDLCRAKGMCQKNEDGTYEISLIMENDWNLVSYVLTVLLAGAVLVFVYRIIRRQRKPAGIPVEAEVREKLDPAIKLSWKSRVSQFRSRLPKIKLEKAGESVQKVISRVKELKISDRIKPVLEKTKGELNKIKGEIRKLIEKVKR